MVWVCLYPQEFMRVLYIPGGFFARISEPSNSSTCKMDGWKMILSFWGTAHFQGQLLVLGRVYSLSGSGETMDSTFESKKSATNLQVYSIHHALKYTRVHVYTTCKLNKFYVSTVFPGALHVYYCSYTEECHGKTMRKWLLDAFIFGRHEQECLQPTHINRHLS